ncbi:hypothetical protein ACWEPN_27915 [Nonomuraea wenchangensis]
MDCQFCAEFMANEGSTRIITSTDAGWVLLPSIGAFTRGYCLFMPLLHVDALADMALADLTVVAEEAERMRGLIEASYGPAILAEHGPRDCELGASCCSHCHLHVIPVPDPDAVTAAYHKVGGKGLRLKSMADLPSAVNSSYLYLSPRSGEEYCWPSAGFNRQFVRRVCAEQLGLGSYFDWRDHPFEGNCRATYVELSSTVRRVGRRS